MYLMNSLWLNRLVSITELGETSAQLSPEPLIASMLATCCASSESPWWRTAP
jgi:hypothetical protein